MNALEKPMFKKENVLFMREEHEGHWTLLPKFHPETRELIINSTSKMILDFCDGCLTVDMIIKKIVHTNYTIGEEQIRKDVNRALALFSRLQLIEWKGENPFLFKREQSLSDCSYFLQIGTEDELPLILDFIKNSVQNKNDVIINDKISYINPNCAAKEYEELVIRQKLFSYTEDFFLLMNGNKIEGMISIMAPVYPKTTGEIKLICCPHKYVKELILYSLDNMLFIATTKITKVRITTNGIELNSNILEIFSKEYTAKNEYEFDQITYVYSYDYQQERYEEVSKRKLEFSLS